MRFFAFKSPSSPSHLVRLMACALLPACVQETIAGVSSRPTSRPASTPYLLVCPPPPLRFAEPVEAADPVSTAPTVIGPPHPAGIVEEIASVNREASRPSQPVEVTPALSPSTDQNVPASDNTVIETPRSDAQTGISILPDETPREIRSEDVLFYFQFPASAPSNEALPRSSATYRQQ